MGFPVEMFPVLFAIPRTAGWVAQWQEMLLDSEQKIARPRQLYLGEGKRDYVSMAGRAMPIAAIAWSIRSAITEMMYPAKRSSPATRWSCTFLPIVAISSYGEL